MGCGVSDISVQYTDIIVLLVMVVIVCSVLL